MTAVQESRSPLETEPVQKLIVRYAIPTALTLMVNCLYNIVDQIFVGQGVGVTGMAATNVAFPLSIVTVALALFLGDGCSANMSLCLGRREQEQADRTISCAVTMLLAAGVLLLAVVGIFAPQIVILFGSTETAYADALAYTRLIALGLPFQLFCTAFASIIRLAASLIASTIFTYPVHLHRLLEMPLFLISSSVGFSIRSRSALADITIPGVQYPHCTAPASINAC